MIARSTFLALALGLCATSQVLAQDAWPAKPIKLIVPFAAGGNTDTIARLTAEHLVKTLSANFVIENQTGAGGIVAANAVAKSAPDGYTLFLVASPQFAIVPAMQTVTYDPVKDFTPPNVPTVMEQGVAGFETGAWNGLVGPANLPGAIVARLEKALGEFLKAPATQKRFDELGLEPDFGGTADFAARIKADISAWAEIVKLAGAKPQ